MQIQVFAAQEVTFANTMNMLSAGVVIKVPRARYMTHTCARYECLAHCFTCGYIVRDKRHLENSGREHVCGDLPASEHAAPLHTEFSSLNDD